MYHINVHTLVLYFVLSYQISIQCKMKMLDSGILGFWVLGLARRLVQEVAGHRSADACGDEKGRTKGKFER